VKLIKEETEMEMKTYKLQNLTAVLTITVIKQMREVRDQIKQVILVRCDNWILKRFSSA